MYGARILSEYAADTPGVEAWRRALGYDIAPHIERREWARLKVLLDHTHSSSSESTRASGAVAKTVTDGSTSDVL